MTDENRRHGEIFERYDPNSRKDETYRINPNTGEEETLVRGAVGYYWQDSSRIIRDPWGIVIDLEG